MFREANPSIDYTNKDYESFRNSMLEKLKEKMPEYTDLRESDAGVVIIELLAMGLDILSFYQDVYANEVFLTTAEQRESITKWCSILGYTPRFATTAKFMQVFELVGPQNTSTKIPKGTLLQTSTSSGEEAVYFETMEDLLIPRGAVGTEKDSSDNYKYMVKVAQGVPVNNELLGSSNNSPSQKFLLKQSPVVVDDTLQVLVNQGWGYEPWTRVDNFVESNPYDKHYIVSVDNNGRTTIVFGDGVFGAIPKDLKEGIYANYRIGGGDIGNVGVNKINTLATNIALVKSTFNPALAYESGKDEETLEEIRVNAPIANRTRFGALTLQDFSDVIKKDFTYVKDAQSKRDPENQDNIYIYLLLVDNETLTEDHKEEILNEFNENEGGRKIVGADKIFLEPATFVDVDITAELVVDNYYQKELVKDEVETFLTNYFRKGDYPFNKELSFSALTTEIFNNVKGVKSFRITSPTDLVLTPEIGEIYALNSLEITASGGVESGT